MTNTKNKLQYAVLFHAKMRWEMQKQKHNPWAKFGPQSHCIQCMESICQ